MEIKQQYLQHYLHNIAVDQLLADYQARGYQVAKDERVGVYRADLVAKKGDEVVVVEVKAGKMTPQKRRQVVEIGDYVRTQKNYKFLIVVATPPKPKRIDIPSIEKLLFDHLVKKLPDDLEKLPAKLHIRAVNDVNLNEVTLTETGDISVEGTALIEVEVQLADSLVEPYFNEVSIGHIEVFPCSFGAILTYAPSKQLILSEMKDLIIETSDYFQ